MMWQFLFMACLIFRTHVRNHKPCNIFISLSFFPVHLLSNLVTLSDLMHSDLGWWGKWLSNHICPVTWMHDFSGLKINAEFQTSFADSWIWSLLITGSGKLKQQLFITKRGHLRGSDPSVFSVHNRCRVVHLVRWGFMDFIGRLYGHYCARKLELGLRVMYIFLLCRLHVFSFAEGDFALTQNPTPSTILEVFKVYTWIRHKWSSLWVK